MAWDDDKSNFETRDEVAADEKLTAPEWNQHVTDGHFPADELNLGVNGDGDPVFTDPKNGDVEVLRYDRSEGAWVVDAITTESASIANAPTSDDDALRHQDVQAGEVASSSGGISGASDDGWDTRNNETVSVSFGTAFPNAPKVVASLDTDRSAGGNHARCMPRSPTTSGFTADFQEFGTGGTAQLIAYWAAREAST